MELRELGYFLAVYEERSVSAAARRSYVSQPSVSEALANLEHELATRLFVRHRKGATPTAAGEQLYPIAQRLVAEARALPSLFQPAPRRRLILGLMRSLDLARVRGLVARLTAAGHELQLVDADQPCDLRVVSRTLRTEREVFVTLWQERYVVALPRAHPLSAHRTLRASDLAGARLVARCHCEHAARFAGPGQRFDVVAVAPTEEWALALVAAGVGIAIIPEGSHGADGRSAAADPAIVLRPLRDVQARREVGLAYGAQGAPAELQQVIELLVQQHSPGPSLQAESRRVSPPRRSVPSPRSRSDAEPQSRSDPQPRSRPSSQPRSRRVSVPGSGSARGARRRPA